MRARPGLHNTGHPAQVSTLAALLLQPATDMAPLNVNSCGAARTSQPRA